MTIDLSVAATPAVNGHQAGGVMSATIAEMLAADPENLQTVYVVRPWIPEGGIGVLSGKAGVGKGKLVQDLCIARGSGGTWLGLPVTPGPALFWSAEQGRREDFRVTQALCRGRALNADAFTHYFEVIYDPDLRFGHPEMVADVTARLAQHPGLLIVVDSLRRAFEGDDGDSAAADMFYRTVLVPLRRAGGTILILAHPPKTTGTMKMIADENMIRGSGDWVGQIDTFFVLRPVNRTRHDPRSETLTMRLSHVKARSGPQAVPLLVSLVVTEDDTPLVAFRLSAEAVPDGASSVEELAGAVRAIAAYMAQVHRAGRACIVDALKDQFGRPTVEAGIKQAVALGILCGPLDKALKRKGERGHWYLFVSDRPTSANPADATGEDDELPF
jgi:AAA domain